MTDGGGAARTQLNLAGQVDAASGEAQRNENNRVNPLDNNTQAEINQRVGATATFIDTFEASRGYFGAEYGANTSGQVHLRAAPPAIGYHGSLYETHQNSVTTARTFFQVGGVKPAHDNNYGFNITGPGPLTHFWRGMTFTINGNQDKSRGQVNGNVLVPGLDERTPLTTDPALYQLLSTWLAGYPAQAPNLPNVSPRALNTNAPQNINTNSGGGRLNGPLKGGQFSINYQFTSQHVSAFQLVAGQNPDSNVHNHRGVMTWNKPFSATLQGAFSVGFDRITTAIYADPTAPPYRINVSNITTTGLSTNIPVKRLQNRFRYAASLNGVNGNHQWSIGAEANRMQINSKEQRLARGFISFQNNFGNSAVTNFRMGEATSAGKLVGNTYRGWRTLQFYLYAQDRIRINDRLQMEIGLRYVPFLKPTEVNHLDTMPFGCSCSALAPRISFAYRLPGSWGVIRSAYGMAYGQLLQSTWGQIRQNFPNAAQVILATPNPLDPFAGLKISDVAPGFRASLYQDANNLGLPYTHNYNFTWEFSPSNRIQFRLGYIGSRSHRLLEMLYNNRAQPIGPVSNITSATVNDRRPNPAYYNVYRIHNGGGSYFDAAKVEMTLAGVAGFSGDISYWFSKAIDFGNNYTSTLAGSNGNQGRSPSQNFVHDQMKGRSNFDQPHALLVRMNYEPPAIPRVWANGLLSALFNKWTINGVWLLKSGTPFTVNAGSDGPGVGNVDSQGGDRPNIVDPSILGRIVGSPDSSRQLLPRSAFQFITPGTDHGNLGRNTFRRGKIANVNASLTRSFTLPRDWRLTFRVDAINLFNTPQFANPQNNLTSPTFGIITNTLNSGRMFNFRMALDF